MHIVLAVVVGVVLAVGTVAVLFFTGLALASAAAKSEE